MKKSGIPRGAPRHRGEKKRRVPRFLVGVLCLLLVNAAAVTAALVWLYGALSDYERHTPQNALNAYFGRLAAGDYADIQRTSGFAPNEINSWDDYFELLNAQTGGSAEELSYRIKASQSLAAGEALYAVYRGEQKLCEVILSPDESAPSGHSVRWVFGYLDGYTVIAPPAAQVFVNGEPLDQSAPSAVLPVTVTYTKDEAGNPVTVNIFGALDDAPLAPSLVEYTTSQSLREPDFTATAADGTPLAVEVDRQARRVFVSIPPNETQQAEAGTLMETVAAAYSDFITEDGTLAGLRQYVYANTTLYRDFSEYQRGWYLDHENREFSGFTCSLINFHSPECFTGHIDFTVYITRQGTLHTFEASYDMAFMKLDGQWLLVGLHARSAPSQPAE